MTTYNHAFTIAFEIGGSSHPEGGDITPEQMAAALRKRADELLANGEMLEAVGAPFDTFKETE